ncbi:hypothetical protein D3C87_1414260 [compost metagenome]
MPICARAVTGRLNTVPAATRVPLAMVKSAGATWPAWTVVGWAVMLNPFGKTAAGTTKEIGNSSTLDIHTILAPAGTVTGSWPSSVPQERKVVDAPFTMAVIA